MARFTPSNFALSHSYFTYFSRFCSLVLFGILIRVGYLNRPAGCRAPPKALLAA